jgi:simple sugar transport system permease protein
MLRGLESLRLLLPSGLALLVAFAVGGLVVALAGRDPWLAFTALLDGSFGSLDSLSEVGVKACPLLLVGIAVAIAFRAGIWNIGGEGQLLAGAIAVAWLGGSARDLPGWCAVPLMLVAAACAGALWAAVAAFLKVRRHVSEVISTIMLNFVALGLVSYLVHGPLMESAGAYPQTDAVGAAMRLPRFDPLLRVHAGLLVALLAAGLSSVLLFRTVFGYEMRAVGGNADAARLAGIRIERCIFITLLLSGGLAGLAGGIEVSAVTYRVYEKFSPGYGFTAIAVALLGRLHPAGVVAAAFLLGALEAGSNSMQRVAGVSSVLVSVLQATVIFSLIAVEGGRVLRRRTTTAD